MARRSGTSHVSRLASRRLESLRRRPIVRALREACERRGLAGWIVGGALRDALLGLPVAEVDAAVDGDPEPLARELERAGLGRAVFLSDGRPGPRVFRLASRATELDLAAVEGASIEEDLARRDFTVNALALPLGGGPALDPFGGAADLARGVLRGIRARNFEEDPLRALRAARLIATRALEPDEELLRWSRAAAPGLAHAAAERVSAELAKLLAAPCVAPALRWAARAGILPAALGLAVPDTACARLARDAAARLARDAAARLARDATPLDGSGVRALAPDRRRRLRLAWLAARLGRDEAAARSWLAGRRWGRRESEEAASLVSLAARAARAPRGDAAWRWVLDAGPLAADAARLAAVLRPRSATAARRLARLSAAPRRAVRATGRDVMEWTGLPPGPPVGALLDGLAVAAAAGRVRTRREARNWLTGQVSNARNRL
jgi:tRNA nucleotidyltransferase/poly(A) polymerase